MIVAGSTNPLLLASAAGGYNLTRSLRFRSSASAYLNRTPASAGNQKTWTYSAWVKRGNLASSNYRLLTVNTGSSDATYMDFGFNTSNQLYFASWNSNFRITTQVFRDPSAWYHIVLAFDTTQATASNRVKLYVNGVEVTSFGTNNNPTLNADYAINSNQLTWIGFDGSNYYDGYMTEVNFIDGQALTPSSFGETSSTTGVWQPKRYSGTYGTNGFYLPFTSNTVYYSGLFDGSTQTAYVNYNSVLNLGTTDYTIEAFVNPTSLSNSNGQQQIIGRWNGAVNNRSYLLGVNNDGSVFFAASTNGQTGTGNSISVSSSAGAVTTNTWTHIRVSQTGGTVYLGINGTIVNTATSSIFNNVYSTTDSVALGASLQADTNTLWTGRISNVRIVKGTALSTSSYTVPTAPLTAISGTSLLTLQSSTLIDNSGNSLTITNPSSNPSISTTAPTQFGTVGYGTDYSGNGNNWTTNNLSYTAGSTYDSMTDVPTLTSATASNFCTINPLDSNASVNAPSQTITNGNLKMTNAVGQHSVTRATIAASSGKFYWEIKVDSITNFYSGICKTTADLTTFTTVGSDNTSWAYVGSNGDKRYNATTTAYGSALTAGDVLGCALDLDNGKVWWSVNGTWQASGNPATGTNPAFTGISGDLTAAAGCYTSTINYNFGQQPFAYTPPTGYVALNTYNLPTPTIGATASSQANKYFDVKLWTGDGTSPKAVVSDLSFQPDFVWSKDRTSAYSHQLYDAVRGAGSSKNLMSNSTDAEGTNASLWGYLSSFNSNGFTITGGSDGANSLLWGNKTSDAYVAWNWKANGGTGVTNTAGSITSTVSANTSSGFSVVTYTGNGTGGTIGHGLGVKPSMVIVKNRSSAYDWPVWFTGAGTQGTLFLNLTDAQTDYTNIFGAEPTSSVFTVGNGFNVSKSGNNFVAYCFSEVAGYSKFGRYTGNGSSDGTFVYTGFKPRYLMIKRSNTAGYDWWIFDSARNTYNALSLSLEANLSDAEQNIGGAFDFTANGFKFRTSYAPLNESGGTYIYMAFAENPFKYSLAR